MSLRKQFTRLVLTALGIPSEGDVITYEEGAVKWAAQGGNATAYTRITKSESQTVVGTDDEPYVTETEDDELTFEVEEGKMYLVRGEVYLIEEISNQSWKGNFIVPTDTIINGNQLFTGSYDGQMFTNEGSYDKLEAYSVGSALKMYRNAFCFVMTAGDDGNVTLNHIDESGTTDGIDVLKGSFVEFTEIG